MSNITTMCERCDGLCCRIYDIFDHESGKMIKRAGDKCGYLDITHRCRIYTSRNVHPGFRDSCDTYDCMEGGPIVTLFARRIGDHPLRTGILSSLLETIRLRIVESPQSRDKILQLSATLLNNLTIDDTLHIAVKLVRVKIELWKDE